MRKAEGSPRRGLPSPLLPGRHRGGGGAAPRSPAGFKHRLSAEPSGTGQPRRWGAPVASQTPKAPPEGSGCCLTSARPADPSSAVSPGKRGPGAGPAGAPYLRPERRRECWKSRTRPRCTGRSIGRGRPAGSRSVGRPSEVTRRPEPLVRHPRPPCLLPDPSWSGPGKRQPWPASGHRGRAEQGGRGTPR